jgi:hypothetical protein
MKIIGDQTMENIIDFYDVKKNKKAKKIIESLYKKYEVVGFGRNRITFKLRSGNYVIKFPLSEAGEGDNDWEGSVVSNKKEDSEDIKYPKTRYLTIEGFVCVIMEIVKELEIEEYWFLKEDWFGSVDGGQVGKTRSGHVVAYDYGIN